MAGPITLVYNTEQWSQDSRHQSEISCSYHGKS